MRHNVPVQSLIDHIKTAIDVDPWAKEMAEELLKEQPQIVRCKDCRHYKDGFCYNPNTYDDGKTRGNTVPDWYCADGERRDE